MTGWKNGYMTKSHLTSCIKKVVSKTHGLKVSDIKIKWVSSWKITKYPTGLIAKSGKITMESKGFWKRSFIVTQEQNQRWSMM